MPGSQSPLVRVVSFSVVLALALGACGPRGNFTALTADDPVADLPEGLSVSANPALVPDGFGVDLQAISAETFAGDQAGDAWKAAQAALPANLHLKSPLYTLQSKGKLPDQLFLSVAPAAGANPATLDLYAWTGRAWDFLPAQVRGGQLVATVTALPQALALFQAALLPPLAYAGLEPGQALSDQAAEAVNAVLPGGVLAKADGTIGGQLPGVAQGKAYAVYPVVRNYGADGLDQAVLPAILSDDTVRTRHLETLLAFVVSANYGGLVLDYAGVTPDLGPAYAQFVFDLAAQMHAQGKSLFVQVETPSLAGDALNTAGYDWRALGSAADALLVPVGADPGVYGNGLADKILAWAVGEAPRSRVRLVTSALSAESVDGDFRSIGSAEALAPLGSASLAEAGEAAVAALAGEPISVKLSGQVESLAYDPLAFAARYAYTDAAGKAHTLWLTSAATLRQRLALAASFQLGGVVVQDLMADGVPAELVNALTQYKVSIPASSQSQADVLWTVKAAGSLLALATAQPNEPYVYVPPAAGQYEFSASLQHGQADGLGSVAVSVAEVTPTPTIPPTATPRPSEGGSATSGGNATPSSPATAAPTTAPSSGGGVFVPPPPIGAGNFELGGQVPGFISHPLQMQQAGMKWVKFQATGDAAGFVSAGHSQGFKVLLSAVGDRSRAADPAYWPEYASWVAGMAAAGADAIEVWNEANIDREWPTGQISAATYTQLLKQAYTAIKAANSGTLVISGAPAPTGAEGAFPGKVVNDDRFMREMAAAGAANYLDCLGIHFNTGTTSPKDTSGSTLSGYHYSYYFWPMVDTYYNAFAGTRPLCFTELGYLSPDGYGGLPPAFGWGANTSVAEQAQWLAEAASLSGNSGKVRLMIVFNVDFTLYGDDPQGGYAIIRPDGSCPACSALGAVVH